MQKPRNREDSLISVARSYRVAIGEMDVRYIDHGGVGSIAGLRNRKVPAGNSNSRIIHFTATPNERRKSSMKRHAAAAPATQRIIPARTKEACMEVCPGSWTAMKLPRAPMDCMIANVEPLGVELP